MSNVYIGVPSEVQSIVNNFDAKAALFLETWWPIAVLVVMIFGVFLAIMATAKKMRAHRYDHTHDPMHSHATYIFTLILCVVAINVNPFISHLIKLLKSLDLIA